MDSLDSSPRSRDPDADNNNNHHHHRRQPSFDDAPPKVKLMCSFGGSIQPRPHDNHLTYVAGDTKILAVDRHVKFPSLIAKLSSFANNTPSNLSFFKYQLPGEDLDALISVTNDDDLHQMMIEYDRLSRASPIPARLRLFLFPLHNNCNFAPTESKSERQWFVDALNSVHVPEDSRPPPPPATANPDFLFGLDKPPAEDALVKDSECFPEDREAEPQIENENNSKQLLQRKMKIEEDDNNNNGRVYGVNGGGNCYAQKNAEKMTPLVAHAHAHTQFVHPGSVTGTVSFMQERNNNNAGYSLAVPTTGNEIYLIQTPSGMFQAVRPVTGPVGQPVYLLHAPGPVSHSELSASAERGGARW